MQGQITKIHSDFYYINEHECKIREILKKQKTKIFVGDFVEYENGVINSILSRKNYIPRPSVANIDQVIIVSAVKEPELNFIQLNRYITLAKYYGIPAKLCFNKNDLSMDDTVIEKVFSIYEPLSYEIVFTSALEKDGIDDLLELLNGKLSVLCGSSGVGKSSLINAINPKLNLRTQAVSEKTERGTHTTRHCEIISIENELKIVDTPGFSNLKFDFLMPHEVGKLFDEIKQYKSLCKYNDCLHIKEDGCNVLNNIENIDLSRYDSYLTFVEEAKEYKERVKYFGTKTETAVKTRHNRDYVKISAQKRQSSRKTQKQSIHKTILEGEE